MSRSREPRASDFAIPAGYRLADHIDDSTMQFLEGFHGDKELIDNKELFKEIKEEIDDNTLQAAAQRRLDLLENLINNDNAEVLIEVIKRYLKKNNTTPKECMVYGISLLSLACFYSNKAAVQWLIDNGAEVNEKNAKGWAPLHFQAADNCRTDSTILVAQMLVNAKADVNLRTDKTGRTPLMISAARTTIDMDLAKFLLRSRANVRVGREGLIADKTGMDIMALAGKEVCLMRGEYHEYYLQKIEIAEKKGTPSETSERVEKKQLRVADASIGPAAEEAVKDLIKMADDTDKELIDESNDGYLVRKI